jgi:hypothetical protein
MVSIPTLHILILSRKKNVSLQKQIIKKPEAKMVKTRSNENYINALNSADACSVSASMAIEQSTSTAVPPPEKS